MQPNGPRTFRVRLFQGEYPKEPIPKRLFQGDYPRDPSTTTTHPLPPQPHTRPPPPKQETTNRKVNISLFKEPHSSIHSYNQKKNVGSHIFVLQKRAGRDLPKVTVEVEQYPICCYMLLPFGQTLEQQVSDVGSFLEVFWIVHCTSSAKGYQHDIWQEIAHTHQWTPSTTIRLRVPRAFLAPRAHSEWAEISLVISATIRDHFGGNRTITDSAQYD